MGYGDMTGSAKRYKKKGMVALHCWIRTVHRLELEYLAEVYQVPMASIIQMLIRERADEVRQNQGRPLNIKTYHGEEVA